ncbi:hypothetical protein Q8A67_008158 [Cirrhinus molitorella]|uniref:Uncharacterized protein n=1 Tax=Cirrhinus molitorella TaxID=172907 RepID=A0AA88TSI8_9TELE|nr:hypothetical protein Q8A67_008158 [Cirrhinus molitorella]
MGVLRTERVVELRGTKEEELRAWKKQGTKVKSAKKETKAEWETKAGLENKKIKVETAEQGTKAEIETKVDPAKMVNMVESVEEMISTAKLRTFMAIWYTTMAELAGYFGRADCWGSGGHGRAKAGENQADWLKDLDKDHGLSLDEMAELRRTMDLALHATKQATTAMGRLGTYTMAKLATHCRPMCSPFTMLM